MFYDIHDDGTASEVIPHPGQTVEEHIFELLSITDEDDVEFFNPKMLNMRLDVPDLVMIGRRVHKPGEGENMIANILTCHPEKERCYGPYVICRRYGSAYVSVTAEESFISNVIKKLSGIVLKDLPFTVPGEGVKNA